MCHRKLHDDMHSHWLSIKFVQKDTCSFARKMFKCSHMTVSQCVSTEFVLKSHKPAHNPLITTAMKFIDFAKKYGHWTAEQWGRAYSWVNH